MASETGDEKEAFDMVDYLKTNINRAFRDSFAFEKLYLPMGETRQGEDIASRYPYAKCYWFLDGIKEKLSRNHDIEEPVQIFIDPFYEDSVLAILTYGEMDILYAHLDKTDSPRWPNENEMGKVLEEIYKAVEEKYLQLEDP